MFWGLIMEPGRCYTQTVKVSFHVSMAALDISNSSDEPSQVMCVFDGRNYLLCTLNKKDKLQCPLDLNFEVGTKVSFATNGNSHVHLTGYLTSMEDDFEDEEQEEEEQQTASKKDKKRQKNELTKGPPKKKTKLAEKHNSLAAQLEEAQEESSDSDSDFDLNKLDEEEGEDEAEEEGEEEESDEEGDEEEEASSLSGAESEEEEEVEQMKPKQNGITKVNSTPKPKKKKEQVKAEAPKEKPKKQEEKKEQKGQKQQPKGKKTVLKGGVTVQDFGDGSGQSVKAGDFVHVYYEGRLKDNNKKFDSTTKGPGFAFRVGKGEVIKGWDIGLVGMKVGGKRRIICPPNTAYGPKGSPPVIPPNSTLVFDIELKKIS